MLVELHLCWIIKSPPGVYSNVLNSRADSDLCRRTQSYGPVVQKDGVIETSAETTSSSLVSDKCLVISTAIHQPHRNNKGPTYHSYI